MKRYRVSTASDLPVPSTSAVLFWHPTGKKGPRTAVLKEPTLNIYTAAADGNADTNKFAFHFVKLAKIWSIAINTLLETDPFPGSLLLRYVSITPQREFVWTVLW